MGALVVGVFAGALCAMAVGLKFRFGFDDSLDVVGVHLVGGIIGTLLIGFFGTSSTGTTGAADGLFYGGGASQLWRQAVAAGSVLVYSFVIALILGFLINKTIGFRVSEEEESAGIDEAEHAESGYDFTGQFGSGGALEQALGHPPDPAQAAGTAAGREG
jgi:Amt family ammonium transporter